MIYNNERKDCECKIFVIGQNSWAHPESDINLWLKENSVIIEAILQTEYDSSVTITIFYSPA